MEQVSAQLEGILIVKRLCLLFVTSMMIGSTLFVHSAPASAKPRNDCATASQIASAKRLQAGALTNWKDSQKNLDAALSGRLVQTPHGPFWQYTAPSGQLMKLPWEWFYQQFLPELIQDVVATEQAYRTAASNTSRLSRETKPC